MTARGLSDFVKQYTKKGSVSANQAGVISFLVFIYGKQPGAKDGLTKKDQLKTYNDLSLQYIKDGTRDRLNDATSFATSLAGSPPMTARSRLSVVRNFLAYNNIEFSDNQWNRASGKLPKGGARTVEQEIDVLTVRKVLEHSDVKTKALVCFLVSTGCRLNEALGLFIEDVSFDGDKVAKVTIRGELTKTGDARECYCSTESVRYLKEWLKIRPAYMKSAAAKANGLGSERPDADTDNRLFPLTIHTAIVNWNGVAAKAGYGATDRSTGRRTLHLHMMRKLFRSQLALKVPVDVCEALMGHSAYLSEAYRRFTKKQIKELYEKGSSVLHVFGDADISEVREQLESTTKDLQETRVGQQQTATAQAVLVLENQQLKSELATMKTEISDMKTQIKLINFILEQIPGLKQQSNVRHGLP
jgi:integrase